ITLKTLCYLRQIIAEDGHPLRHRSKLFNSLREHKRFYPRLYLRPEINTFLMRAAELKGPCAVHYILLLNAGIARRPTKKLFARAVKPGYQGCISFAQPFGCVASRVSVFLVSMTLKLLAGSLASPVSMS